MKVRKEKERLKERKKRKRKRKKETHTHTHRHVRQLKESRTYNRRQTHKQTQTENEGAIKARYWVSYSAFFSGQLARVVTRVRWGVIAWTVSVVKVVHARIGWLDGCVRQSRAVIKKGESVNRVDSFGRWEGEKRVKKKRDDAKLRLFSSFFLVSIVNPVHCAFARFRS